MQRDISRQSYTKRILEIVASIHKQKAEIERVILDMKSAQKLMNQLKGRIDRTFTAVDEAMFQVQLCLDLTFIAVLKEFYRKVNYNTLHGKFGLMFLYRKQIDLKHHNL